MRPASHWGTTVGRKQPEPLDDASPDPVSSSIMPESVLTSILSIYKVEHRYVESLARSAEAFSGRLRRHQYPYTEGELFEYVTAPMSCLYACQIGYAVVGGIICTRHPLSAMLPDLATFLSDRDRTRLRFGDFNMRFSRAVANRDDIPFAASVVRAKRLGSGFHGLLNVAIDDAIMISSHLVWILEGTG